MEHSEERVRCWMLSPGKTSCGYGQDKGVEGALILKSAGWENADLTRRSPSRGNPRSSGWVKGVENSAFHGKKSTKASPRRESEEGRRRLPPDGEGEEMIAAG
jgi:hypothetical protein